MLRLTFKLSGLKFSQKYYLPQSSALQKKALSKSFEIFPIPSYHSEFEISTGSCKSKIPSKRDAHSHTLNSITQMRSCASQILSKTLTNKRAQDKSKLNYLQSIYLSKHDISNLTMSCFVEFTLNNRLLAGKIRNKIKNCSWIFNYWRLIRLRVVITPLA